MKKKTFFIDYLKIRFNVSPEILDTPLEPRDESSGEKHAALEIAIGLHGDLFWGHDYLCKEFN